MSKVNELEKIINDYFLYKFNFQENIIENKQIGILEGLSGIMLSLLSSHNISKSTWDGMLLLS